MSDAPLPHRSETRPAALRWGILVAVGVLAAAALKLLGSEDTDPPREAAAPAAAGGETSRASVDPAALKHLASNDDWKQSAARFADRVLGVDENAWSPPPAGRDTAAGVAEAQAQAAARTTQVLRVQVLALPGNSQWLEVQSGEQPLLARGADVFHVRLPAAPGDVLALELLQPGFFGLGRKTAASGSLPVSALRPDGAMSLKLGSSDEATVQVKASTLRLWEPRQPFASIDHPTRLEFGPDLRLEHRASIPAGHPGHDLIVPSGARFTALVVTADGPLRDVLYCYRLDTRRQVGIYDPRIPIFAAAADRHAPLLVRLRGGQPRALSYSVKAVSMAAEPGLEAAAWTATTDLMRAEQDRLPLSDAQLRERAAWLAAAFALRVQPQDARRVADPAARRIVQALAVAASAAAGQAP